MSDLTSIEKRRLERAFGMASGYVLDFTNRTFEDFFDEFLGVQIYDSKYSRGSGSKASRMRAFWDSEPNHVVGKMLSVLFDNWDELRSSDSPATPPNQCLAIAQRMIAGAPVPDIEAVTAITDERTFETLARSVRDAIEKDEPDAGIDRLHTFLVRFMRAICQERGIKTPQDKPLHSLGGEYVKSLRRNGEIESTMTERILKSSISILDAFNDVRNNQSLAHDNELLSYHESTLIFANITSLIRFIRSIEGMESVPMEILDGGEAETARDSSCD